LILLLFGGMRVDIVVFAGLIDSGSGPDPLNNLLSALNVPPVSKGLIKRHEAYIAPAFEKAASMSCMRGILEEKRLALE